jgi:ferrous iron transport protein A
VSVSAIGSAPGSATTVHNRSEVFSLDSAPTGIACVIHEVSYAQGAHDWPQRLEELGFLPGERVMVMARAAPGRDPLSIRVGHSTFALRRAEAACVRVRPWPESAT